MSAVGSQTSTLPFYLNRDVFFDNLTILSGPADQLPLKRVNNLSDITNVAAAQLNLGVVLDASPVVVSAGPGLSLTYTDNIIYSTGQASQAGNTVIGVATTFTSEMVGGVIYFTTSGAMATIIGFVDSTTLTTAESQSVLPVQPYLIIDPIYIPGTSRPVVITNAGSPLTLPATVSNGTVFAVTTSYSVGIPYGTVQTSISFPAYSYPLATFSTSTSTIISLNTRNSVAVQAADPTLTALSTLYGADGEVIYFTGPNAVTTTASTVFGRTLLAKPDASTFRTDTGLQIGTDVQAHSAKLDSFAGVGFSAKTIPYTVDGTSFSATGLTDYMKNNVLTSIDASAARTALGTVIGMDVQGYDTALASISGIIGTTNAMIYQSAPDVYSTLPSTSYGRGLLNTATSPAALAYIAAAPDIRQNIPISVSTVIGSWDSSDYLVDNGAGPITITFPSPTSNDLGKHSIVWVQANPNLNNVIVRSVGTTDFLNGIQGVLVGAIATFSTAYSSWFSIRVHAVGINQLAVDSSQPFTVSTS